MSENPLIGLSSRPRWAATTPDAARQSGTATGGAATGTAAENSPAARRTAKAIRDFQAVFLMEMLKPLTQELSGAGAEDTAESGFGLSTGADVYSYFWGEALAKHLAGALPGLPGMTAIGRETGGAADNRVGVGPSPLLGPVGALPPVSVSARAAIRAASAASADATAAPVSPAASPASTRGASSLPEEVHALAGKVGRLFSLPENLVRAVVSVESGGRASAVSGKGAVGLMQLMPGTAKEMGVKDSRDAWDNLVGGVKYLARQLERFGSLDQALAAYNAGPGAVEKHGGVPPFPETRDYVRRVLAVKARLDRSHPAGA